MQTTFTSREAVGIYPIAACPATLSVREAKENSRLRMTLERKIQSGVSVLTGTQSFVKIVDTTEKAVG